MTNTVLVIKLRFGYRVIHIDCREQQLAALVEFVKTVNAGGGFFGDTFNLGSDASETRWVFL